MENGPFEDVFPVGNGDILASCVSLPDGIFQLTLVQKLTILDSYPPTFVHLGKQQK